MPPGRGEQPPDATLGAQVRAARTARGVTLRGLARMLDVSPATVSQIETGRTGLSVTRLTRIADALGMTVVQILDVTVGGEDPRPPGPFPVDVNGPAVSWPALSNLREYGPLGFDPVLQAALDEFLAIGYHGATVRGIAARCGLSVSGIYHYYTSKQQMLVRILDLTMVDLMTRAHAARAEGRDPVERFCRLIEHLALYHTHRRELGFVGASEMRSVEAGDHQRIAAERTAQQRMVDHEVEQAVRAGFFRVDHPHEAARAAVTMCTGLPTWWQPGGSLSPEQVADQYVGLALDLMRARIEFTPTRR